MKFGEPLLMCAAARVIPPSYVPLIVVDAQRARVDCNVKINLSSDGPVDVRIVNASEEPCGGTVVPASVARATTTSLASLPNTSAGAGAGAGAGGLALVALLATRVRRRGWRRR